MIKLFHFPICPFSRRVRLSLSEMNIPFSMINENIWDKRREFLALNPAGTLPLIIDEYDNTIINTYTIIEYIEEKGLDEIAKYEDELLAYATKKLKEIPGIRIIGEAKEKTSVISFVIENVHPHDIGTFMDQDGVAVRTGHHCTQPIMERFNIPGTARISFAVYNTKSEIDICINAIRKAKQMLS